MSRARRPTTTLVIGMLLVSAGMMTAQAASAQGGDEVTSDRVIVRFAPGVDGRERARVRDRADVEAEEQLPLTGAEVVDPAPGTTAREAVESLAAEADVLYAEPDVVRRSAEAPNDPLLGQEWGLHNRGQAVAGGSGPAGVDIDAPQAWSVETGNDALRIAVVDTGIQLDHPGLESNIWRNPGESGGGRESNGIDDDRNGYADDVRGWDFVEDDRDATDANGHGTHVAGTLAATGNNSFGISGVVWQASLIPVRVLGANGSGSVSDLVSAYRYAARSGARVVNVSVTGGAFSQAEYDAIAAAPNTLFVVAAGNNASDNDSRGAYPCDHDLPNVVCVAAIDRQDRLAAFSNYGARQVDLAAPGVDVTSTWPGGGWAVMNGTSMATPLTAGVAALLLGLDGGTTVAGLRARLLAGVRPVAGLAGRVATGGRLNAAGALRAAGANVPDLPDGESTLSPSYPAPAVTRKRSRADREAPTVQLRIVTRRLGVVLRRGLTAKIQCSETCNARLSVSLRPGGVAGAKAGQPASARVARVVAARGRSATARVHLNRRARATLGRRRSIAVTVHASVTDLAGNTRRTSRKLTLRR